MREAPKVLRGKAWTRWVACGDNHGDKVHAPTLAAFRDFVRDFKPQHRIHWGDCFNFAQLRSKAKDEERFADVQADYEAGCDFLAWFVPHVVLRGNHDERLWDLIHHPDGMLRHLAGQWIDHIEVITKQAAHRPYCKRRGVYRYGDHAFIHGYCHGVNAARKAALTYGNVVMGHVHYHDQATIERHDRAVGHTVGCLCELDLDYNRANLGTLRQEHGWAYGWKSPTGELVVMHARHIGGEWVCPVI